jgi:glutamine synthetase
LLYVLNNYYNNLKNNYYNNLNMNPTIIEYIWLADDQSLRGKARTYFKPINKLEDIEDWNYDGSSTGQSPGNDSEILIKPVAMFNDPFRGKHHKLVLCDGYHPNGNQASGYNRKKAVEIFNDRIYQQPWFGIEQEYILFELDGKTPLGWPTNGFPGPQGPYYCSVGTNRISGRSIMETHYQKCLEAGLTISGTNAEVMLGQWEYQVGPCLGIDSGDQLWISRYIMERVCEDHNIIVNFEPKPIEGNWNGSGCHTNYSTKDMREIGIKDIFDVTLQKLQENHHKHIDVYGKDNEKRLTGLHETASIDKFSYGIADRGASIRIPRDTAKNWKGYIEDRRPASNMDPYLVTAIIAETTISPECCKFI